MRGAQRASFVALDVFEMRSTVLGRGVGSETAVAFSADADEPSALLTSLESFFDIDDLAAVVQALHVAGHNVSFIRSLCSVYRPKVLQSR